MTTGMIPQIATIWNNKLRPLLNKESYNDSLGGRRPTGTPLRGQNLMVGWKNALEHHLEGLE